MSFIECLRQVPNGWLAVEPCRAWFDWQGLQVPCEDVQGGDLLWFDGNGAGHHVGVALGPMTDGRCIMAHWQHGTLLVELIELRSPTRVYRPKEVSRGVPG